MDRNAKYRYWLVQLGELYYAGGLARKSPVKNAFSFEFVSDEALAYPFIDEVFADHVNAKCGGVVTSRETTIAEYSALYERHENYINSEAEWYKEQESAIIDELTKQNHMGGAFMYQRKNNLQVVLESETELNEWFSLLVQRGRKYNYAVNVIGNERIELKFIDRVEVVVLNDGLERIKMGLISLKQKYPLSILNS